MGTGKGGNSRGDPDTITEECKTLYCYGQAGNRQEDYNMSDLEGLKLIPPLQVPPEQFPESGSCRRELKQWTGRDTHGFGVEFLPNVVYANRGGINLHLQIMVPKSGQEPDRKWPLIMFSAGSAWHK